MPLCTKAEARPPEGETQAMPDCAGRGLLLVVGGPVLEECTPEDAEGAALGRARLRCAQKPPEGRDRKGRLRRGARGAPRLRARCAQ